MFTLVRSFFSEAPVLFILAGSFIIFYLVIAIYIYKKKFRYEETNRKPLSRVLEFGFFLVLSVLLIRGVILDNKLKLSLRLNLAIGAKLLIKH